MSKPRHQWRGYVKGMIARYPDRVNEEEKRAVSIAIENTKNKKDAEIRLKVVDLVLMKRTHTIPGAALKCYCSERTAYNYHAEFINEVGKNFVCNGLH